MDQQPALYEETVPLGRLASMVLIAGVSVIIYAAGRAKEEPVAVFIPVPVFVFLGLIYWNYRSIHIRLSTAGFEARYGLVNRTEIASSEITSCEPITSTFGQFGGIGVRLRLDGTWAYTTSFGPAVRFTRRNGRRFVVSSNRPNELRGGIDSMRSGGRSYTNYS